MEDDRKIKEISEIREIDIKDQLKQTRHRWCPICKGKPVMFETVVYVGRADHRWSCERYYYRHIACSWCNFQTNRLLYKVEHDDSDTIYTSEKIKDDSKLWEKWDSYDTSFTSRRY